jgi:hypothetical protein
MMQLQLSCYYFRNFRRAGHALESLRNPVKSLPGVYLRYSCKRQMGIPCLETERQLFTPEAVLNWSVRYHVGQTKVGLLIC